MFSLLRASWVLRAWVLKKLTPRPKTPGPKTLSHPPQGVRELAFHRRDQPFALDRGQRSGVELRGVNDLINGQFLKALELSEPELADADGEPLAGIFEIQHDVAALAVAAAREPAAVELAVELGDEGAG